MSQGVCTQKHFPAVAQPFRVLWAPWSLAAVGIACALVISAFCMIFLGTTFGGIMLAILVPGFHIVAITLGLRLRYLASMVTSLDNRKSGASNLNKDGGGFEYANI